MRKVMQESILLLLAASGSDNLISGSSQPAQAGLLSYQDFEKLRPEIAASSWRGMLNQLVKQRFVVKRYQGKKVHFRLSRLGEEWAIQNLFPRWLDSDNSQVTLVVLKSRPEIKPQYSTVRQKLEEQGFYHVVSGLYASQTGQYSDLLWQQLHQAGFLTVFWKASLAATQPIGLRELLGDEDSDFLFQRQLVEIESKAKTVIANEKEEKGLSDQDILSIGDLLVSGLSLVGRWSGLVFGNVSSREDVLEVFKMLFEVMQVYLTQQKTVIE